MYCRYETCVVHEYYYRCIQYFQGLQHHPSLRQDEWQKPTIWMRYCNCNIGDGEVSGTSRDQNQESGNHSTPGLHYCISCPQSFLYA